MCVDNNCRVQKECGICVMATVAILLHMLVAIHSITIAVSCITPNARTTGACDANFAGFHLNLHPLGDDEFPARQQLPHDVCIKGTLCYTMAK